MAAMGAIRRAKWKQKQDFDNMRLGALLAVYRPFNGLITVMKNLTPKGYRDLCPQEHASNMLNLGKRFSDDILTSLLYLETTCNVVLAHL
jgi:hypothetical protein